MDHAEWVNVEPLAAIEKVMDECSGAVILGFTRYHFSNGREVTGAGTTWLRDVKLPTVWNHIEAALAHARKLPLLVLVEDGVRTDGMLEENHGWDVHVLEFGNVRSAIFEARLAEWTERVQEYGKRALLETELATGGPMGPQVTSRHIRNASELLLFAPIRTGFVVKTDVLVSHVSRLSTILSSLYEPVRAYAERLDIVPSGNVIESLRTIYSVQYAVVEQPARSHLVVAVSFDSSWEAYLQRLVDKVGALLDLIFSHCEGYDRPLCSEGYESFARWIYEHQVQCNLFYNSTPDLTTDDLRYLRQLSRRKLTEGKPLESLPKEAEDTIAVNPRPNERHEVLGMLAQGAFGLREWFQGPGEPKLFDDAARQLFAAYVQPGDAQALACSLPQSVVAWLGLLLAPPPPLVAPTSDASRAGSTPAPERLTNAALANIQGNILEPYQPALYGAVVMIQCDGARALSKLLGAMKPRVTTAQSAGVAVRTNLAITYGALTRLGLSESTLMSFPKELREGMAARSGMLGDIGPSAPENWDSLEVNVEGTEPDVSGAPRPPATLSSVDVVLVLRLAGEETSDTDDFAWTPRHPLFGHVTELRHELAKLGARVFHVQPLRRYPGYDHFGVGDGSVQSQPVPRAVLGDGVAARDLTKTAAARDQVALGELLLGYTDNRNKVALCTQDPGQVDVFKDGTFLVIRKLRQKPESFKSYVDASASSVGVGPDEIKGLLVGRTPDGKTLENQSTSNDFKYTSDRCPLYAHVRRANPRDDDPQNGDRVPRIMRRSLPYGPNRSNAAERGLVFMAYGASIGQQFEVIQRWINGGNSTSILSLQNDLVTGVPQPTGGKYPVPDSQHALPSVPHEFVTVRWGMYLFVPSLKAIEALSQHAPVPERSVSLQGKPAEDSPLVERGKALLDELDAIQDDDTARKAWKQYIEDPHFADCGAALWAAIRRSGPRKTPYGVLVADAVNANKVLSDDGSKFSVREYWARLNDKLGPHYLTIDPALARGPSLRYTDLATKPNTYLKEIKGPDAYRDAVQYTRDAIANEKKLDPNSDSVDLRRVAKRAVARLADDWVGLPGDWNERPDGPPDAVRFLENYITLSRYAFQPYPENWLEDAAKESGQALMEAYASYPGGKMAKHLEKAGYKEKYFIDIACAGAIVGFAAPAVAAAVGVLLRLIDSGDFARLATTSGAQPDPALGKQAVFGAVLRELRRSPVPPLLYRRDIDGYFGAPGGLVVVGLQAVADDVEIQGKSDPRVTGPAGQPWIWLLGGPHGGGAPDLPPHGCPAAEPAVMTIAGIVAGFLAYPKLAGVGFRVSLTGL
jgi:Dyp-type peroxidase family